MKQSAHLQIMLDIRFTRRPIYEIVNLQSDSFIENRDDFSYISASLASKKTLYNPEDPNDLEELLEYFHSLVSNDVVYRQIQDAESLEVALISPDDGEDSDQDDAASDDDIVTNIRD
nr:unnamed protein product [Callosobruchus analis]